MRKLLKCKMLHRRFFDKSRPRQEGGKAACTEQRGGEVHPGGYESDKIPDSFEHLVKWADYAKIDQAWLHFQICSCWGAIWCPDLWTWANWTWGERYHAWQDQQQICTCDDCDHQGISLGLSSLLPEKVQNQEEPGCEADHLTENLAPLADRLDRHASTSWQAVQVHPGDSRPFHKILLSSAFEEENSCIKKHLIWYRTSSLKHEERFSMLERTHNLRHLCWPEKLSLCQKDMYFTSFWSHIISGQDLFIHQEFHTFFLRLNVLGNVNIASWNFRTFRRTSKCPKVSGWYFSEVWTDV